MSGEGRLGKRGQAFVEFALILPVLLLLVMMALDLGRVFLAAVTINNTARVGARFAAAYPEAWGATPDAARQADYLTRIGAEWADIDCDKQSPVPGPVFGGSMTIGQPVTVTLTCTFHVLTPIISDILGNTVVLTGRAIIPITSCTETATIPGGGDEACVNPPTLAPPPTPTPTPDPCIQPPTFTVTPLTQSALAGAALSYNVSFVNNDTSPCVDRNVTFSAVVNTGTPGWTSSFGQTTFLLTTGSTANTTLTVTSPNTAPVGSVTITVQATGATNQSVAYVVQTCNQPPVLSAVPTTNQGPVNFGQTFTITLQNPDPAACAARSFNFSASVPNPAPGNWPFTFAPNPITVAAGSSGSTLLTVTPNSSASGSKNITVTTNLGGSTTVTATVVTCTQAPTLSAVPTTNSGGPNAGQAFTITLLNNDPAGCAPRAFTFSANVPGSGSANWPFTFSPNPITVAAAATGTTTFTVTPNSSASGSKDITITTNSGGSVVVTATVVTCTQTPTLSAVPTSRTGTAGTPLNYTITLLNNDPAGCAPRTFTFNASVPNPGSANWPVTWNPVSRQITVAAQATGNIIMTVTPNAAATGSKVITVTTVQGGSVNVTATVGACTAGQPSVVVTPGSQTGFQGDSKNYTVTVTNNDSAACAPRTNQPLTGKERLNNPHFSVILNPNTLTLSPGQVGTSTMTVTPDGSTPPNTYNIDVTWAAVTGSTQYVVQLAPTPSPSPTPTPTPTPTPPPPPPTANFDCLPLIVVVNDPVDCTDSSTGNIASWSWDFGDGTLPLDTNQNPTHQYASAGTYTVVLTVDGPDGSDSRTRTAYITVNP